MPRRKEDRRPMDPGGARREQDLWKAGRMWEQQVKLEPGPHHFYVLGRSLHQELSIPLPKEVPEGDRAIGTDAVKNDVVIGIDGSSDPTWRIQPESARASQPEVDKLHKEDLCQSRGPELLPV
ncbi:UNVERIFIED_CONTAM: hypothetical protein K2H54_048588 [Gekko kuhli]